MAQASGSAISALARGFYSLSNIQKLGLLAAAAAFIAVVVVAVLWARTPEYRVLYANLSDVDGGEVLAALEQLNVPHRVSGGGGAILVPASEVYNVRLKLAAQGLPKGGAVGFELMDTQKFGISQFAEQVNYQRALAGELSRTVQAMAPVRVARVHLAIPRPSVFVRETQQPSASVLVSLYPGRTLDAAQVSAIQHLVASSVPELQVGNVTVVDQAGSLLSAGAPLAAGLDASQLRYLHALEAGYASRIEAILRPLVGAENVRAQVTALLDFSQVEQTSESFKPNSAPEDSAVRSQQTVETTSSGLSPGPSGVPGALSNQPPGAASAPLTSPPRSVVATAQPPTPTSSSSHREKIVNYEVDKTIRHTKEEVGTVKRLSAAIVVNYRRESDAKGRITHRPLPQAELAQITALAREAMGFSQERGDTLNVVNAPFSGEAMTEAAPAPSPWVAFTAELTSPAAVLQAVKYVAGMMILAVVFFGIVRPVYRDLIRAGRVAAASGAVESQLAGAGGYGPTPEANYEADLRAVRDLARQEPRVVAGVVREWVGRE